MNLMVPPARIGLLGPNGAGKSTLIKLLLGLIEADGGNIRVLDFDPVREGMKLRAHIGYMPEGDSVMPELSAVEFVSLAGKLSGLPDNEAESRAHQVLHYVGLGEERYRKLGTYSTGMRQKARFAQALVGSPKLLLLDEPTSGLDPDAREDMLALINDIPTKADCSVIFSTHILNDIEKTCNHVVMMDKGAVLYDGSIDAIRSGGASLYEVHFAQVPQMILSRLRSEGMTFQTQGDHSGIIVLQIVQQRLPELFAWSIEYNEQIRHCMPFKKSLEALFIETIQQEKI